MQTCYLKKKSSEMIGLVSLYPEYDKKIIIYLPWFWWHGSTPHAHTQEKSGRTRDGKKWVASALLS